MKADESDERGFATTLSRRRRLAFWAVLVLLVTTLLEVASWLGLWVLDGQLSLASLQAERSARAQEDRSLFEKGDTRVARELLEEAGVPERLADDGSITLTDGGPDSRLLLPARKGQHHVEARVELSPESRPAGLALGVQAGGDGRPQFRWSLVPGRSLRIDHVVLTARDQQRLLMTLEPTSGSADPVECSATIRDLRSTWIAGSDQAESLGQLRRFSGRESLHPYLGYTMVPGFVQYEPELQHLFVANEYGWLGEGDPVQRRAPDRLLVGVTGGSVAAGFSRLGAERLKECLARSPLHGGREIIVVNLAVRGFKQPQLLMALNYFHALGGELDVLISLDGFNELVLHPTSNASHGVSPLYPNNWLVRSSPTSDPWVLDKLVDLRRNAGRRRSWSEFMLSSALRWSGAANLSWRLMDRHFAARIARRQEQLARFSPEASQASLPLEATGPPSRASTPDENRRELVELWTRCTRQLDRVCRANGTRFVHVLQPNQYVPGSKPLSEAERASAYDGDSEFRPLVEEGYPLLRRASAEMREEGIPSHDLVEAFADVDETLYIDDCCHLGLRGNELLGEAIAAVLLNEKRR